jgi:hypothetical protein
MEADDEVELRKIFGPLDLSLHEQLCCSKVFQVLVIHYDIDWSGGTFEVVSPYPESFIYYQKLFVMDIIIQFGGGKCSGVESDRMDLAVVWRDNG